MCRNFFFLGNQVSNEELSEDEHPSNAAIEGGCTDGWGLGGRTVCFLYGGIDNIGSRFWIPLWLWLGANEGSSGVLLCVLSWIFWEPHVQHCSVFSGVFAICCLANLQEGCYSSLVCWEWMIRPICLLLCWWYRVGSGGAYESGCIMLCIRCWCEYRMRDLNLRKPLDFAHALRKVWWHYRSSRVL